MRTNHTFVSNSSKAPIQFSANVKDYAEPSDSLRQWTSAIIRDYVRPRDYIAEKADRFYNHHLAGRYVIGVHIRGTDALVDPDRILKENRVSFQKNFAIVERLLRVQPDSLIFVASDAQSSVDRMRERFGKCVIAYDSIRHKSGELAGRGPNRGLMPAYLTRDRDLAARNGEEAVVEYLLLCRCDYLVHNGSGIPRAVLLTVPGMPALEYNSDGSSICAFIWPRLVAATPYHFTGLFGNTEPSLYVIRYGESLFGAGIICCVNCGSQSERIDGRRLGAREAS